MQLRGTLLAVTACVLMTCQADNSRPIDLDDIKRLRSCINAGKLLMATPVDEKGKWITLITAGDQNWVYNISSEALSGGKLNLTGAQAPAPFRQAYPKMFEKPQCVTSNCPNVTFEDWLKKDAVLNMYSYWHFFHTPKDSSNVISITAKKESIEKDFENEKFISLRYKEPWNIAANQWMWTTITFHLKLGQPYENAEQQGIWLGSRLNGIITLMAIGQRSVNGVKQTHLDTFVQLATDQQNPSSPIIFTRTSDSNATEVDPSYDNDGMQFCISGLVGDKIKIVHPMEKCSSLQKSPPFGDVYRGFLAGERFFLFGKGYVYTFPLVTYTKPGKEQPLTRYSADDFIYYPGLPTEKPKNHMTDMSRTRNSSSNKKQLSTASSNVAPWMIIFIIILALAIFIGIFIAIWVLCSKPEKPEEEPVKLPQTPKPKGQTKKSTKKKVEAISKKKKKSGEKSKSKKKTQTTKGTQSKKSKGGFKSVAVSEQSKLSTVGDSMAVSTRSSASVASKAKSSTARSSFSSAYAMPKSDASKKKGAPLKKTKMKTVLGKNTSTLMSLPNSNVASSASAASSATSSKVISAAKTKKSTVGPKSKMGKSKQKKKK